MSMLEWVVVIGAAIAGYALVSWLIDSRRKERADAGQSTASATRDAPIGGTAKPEERASSQSAWDEFMRK
jgi:hypothetical protein